MIFEFLNLSKCPLYCNIAASTAISCVGGPSKSFLASYSSLFSKYAMMYYAAFREKKKKRGKKCSLSPISLSIEKAPPYMKVPAYEIPIIFLLFC